MPFWKSYHGRLKFLFFMILLVQVYNAIQWRQEKVRNFGCEICADKAGYYIYLPIWFNYGLEQKNLPQAIRDQTQQHFENDLAPGKNFTKFTSGVALMLSPFYLAADIWYRNFANETPLPISHSYLQFTNFGTALYLTLALLALFSLLKKRFGDGAALLTVLFLYVGTHLRYYVEDESLMSHGYSFAQFAFAWYFLEAALHKRRWMFLALFALCASWAMLIRPTNLLGIPLILVLSLDKSQWKEQSIYLLKKLPVMALAALMIWIPQLIYWKLCTGSWLVYSYQNEGFHLWKNPAIGEQWFAVKSGLLPYAPGFILIPIGLFILLKTHARNGIAVFVSLLFLSYLFASWFSIGFGDCNFGYRPFVEFSALWSIAIAAFFAWLLKTKKVIQIGGFSFVLASILYLNHLYWKFDTCFYGDYWDYAIFIQDYFS